MAPGPRGPRVRAPDPLLHLRALGSVPPLLVDALLRILRSTGESMGRMDPLSHRACDETPVLPTGARPRHRQTVRPQSCDRVVRVADDHRFRSALSAAA